MIDFGELLLRSLELLRDNEHLLRQYRDRFKHVLVDEFQDTNAIQYRWLKLLAGPAGVPFVVGDDDQSIYRWRGARVENLQRFQQDYPGTQIVRLEQNYRSTANILNAANAVIANNSGRLGKTLWTEGAAGAPIKLYAAFNERDEAEFVINRIQDFIGTGGTRSEIAVLYRSNAQSRVFEEGLLAAGIPYRVYGGLRFFERAEIKDALAYLRLIANRDDDPSFERIVNTPPRGIGARTVELVRDEARAGGTSLWRAAAAVITNGSLPKRANEALWAFLQLIERLAAETRNDSLHDQVARVTEQSGLIAHHGKNQDAGGEARVENLEELVTAAREVFADESSDLPPLAEFLAFAVLESGDGQAEQYQDSVQLMTLHSAKGLEFSAVVPLRPRRRPVPAPTVAQRSGGSRGGAPALLRRHHAGAQGALSHARRAAAAARRAAVLDSVAVPARDSGGARRGGPARDDRVAADLPTRREPHADRRRCGSDSACGTADSARASCSTAKAAARTRACRSTSSTRVRSGSSSLMRTSS